MEKYKQKFGDWFFRIALFAIALHFLIGISIGLVIKDKDNSGLLQNTDEVGYVEMAHKISTDWQSGKLTAYSDMRSGDPHAGYYYVVAVLDYLGINSPLALRGINVFIGLAAIMLWAAAVRHNDENTAVSKIYLVSMLCMPSLVFMSSLIIKESWLYLISGAMAAVAASIFNKNPSPYHNAKLFIALLCLIVLMSAFRGYETILIAGIFLIFIAVHFGSKYTILLFIGLISMLVLLNQHLLFFYLKILFNVDLTSNGWSELLKMDFTNPVKFLHTFYIGTSVGGSAIPPGTSLIQRFWLFISFPLPWQAQSILQKMTVPEVIALMAVLPLALYGMWLKLVQKNTLGIFLLTWLVLMTFFYVAFSANLGTLYRHKVTLLFIYIYFAAAGAGTIWESRLKPHSFEVQ